MRKREGNIQNIPKSKFLSVKMKILIGCVSSVLLFILSPAMAWDPDAGVVRSWTDWATVSVTSVTPGSDPASIIDGDPNTFWQSEGCLPTGYVVRPDLNLVLGAYYDGRCTSSGAKDMQNITDGDAGYTGAMIPLQNNSAWIEVKLKTPQSIHTIGARAWVPSAAATVTISAVTTSGTITVGTLTEVDNPYYRNFPAPAATVISIRASSDTPFLMVEIATLAEPPFEAVTVDLGQMREIGWVLTRHWAGGNATATTLLISTDNIQWTKLADLNPHALPTIITRLDTPVMARYLRIRHEVKEKDWAKVFVWEVDAYDTHGPYGPPPDPVPNPHTMAELLGINGIWGWGTNKYSDLLDKTRGPKLYARIATHGRNYHNMDWDVTDPDDLPNYENMPGSLAQWWLDWDREYGAWTAAGLRVEVSIQFQNSRFPVNDWDNPARAAYNYGYAFARHFGPTHGNGIVQAMEIGNEPWDYPADFYRTVLESMARGAKEADPAMLVLPCALQASHPEAPNAASGNYMGARLSQEAGNYIDAINIHAYSFAYTGDGTRIAVHPEHPESGLHGVHNVIRFRNTNLPNMPIYLTEWGWDSDGANEHCINTEGVSERSQALYAVRSALMFAREGLDRLTWYFYANIPDCNTLYCRSGVTGSSKTGFALKKSFLALESLTARLGDRHFIDVLCEDNNAWVYLLGGADGTPTHLVAWRPIDGDDPSTATISVLVDGIPGEAWKLEGISSTGEPTTPPSIDDNMWNIEVSAVPLVVTIIKKMNPVEWILACQRQTGAICNYTDQLHISPYFGNQAAMGLISKGYKNNVKLWMDWYFGHITASGTITDYDIVNGVEVATGDCDSESAYAATFLSLAWQYYQTTGDGQYLRYHQADLIKIADVIVNLQQQDGLTWAKGSYKVKYLMDNCESYRGLLDFASLCMDVFNDTAKRDYYNEKAELMEDGIASLWDVDSYYWAKYENGTNEDCNWNTLYPDAVAQLWPALCKVNLLESDRSQALYDKFCQHHDWTNIPQASAWCSIGYVAARMADLTRTSEYIGTCTTRFIETGYPRPWHSGEAGFYLMMEKELNYKTAIANLLDSPQELGIHYIKNKMAAHWGGFWSNYKNDHAESEYYGTNHEVISETTGLAMLYAALNKERSFFDEQLKIMKKHLSPNYNVLVWKLNPDGDQWISPTWQTYSNAAIDDLRVIRALFAAYDEWGDNQYLNYANRIGQGVKAHNVVGNTLRDRFTWNDGWNGASENVILSYLDFYAMSRLDGWDEIIDVNKKIVLEGQADSGLYWFKYKVDVGTYSALENNTVCMIHNSWVAENLARYWRATGDVECWASAQRFLDFVKAEYQTHSKIYGRYDIITGTNTVSYEDVALYSTVARLASLLADSKFANTLINDAILFRQNKDPQSDLCGSFGFRWSNNDADIFVDLSAINTLVAVQPTHPAQIILQKSANKPSILPGQEITYTITYTNEGLGTATDVTIIDVLPKYCVLRIANCESEDVKIKYWYNNEWQTTFDESATKIKWIIPKVGSGKSGDVSFTVKVE